MFRPIFLIFYLHVDLPMYNFCFAGRGVLVRVAPSWIFVSTVELCCSACTPNVELFITYRRVFVGMSSPILLYYCVWHAL